MAQIFHPSTNTFAKATIFGAVFILAGIAWAGGIFVRSSYVTGVNVARSQPVPFSHDHHVRGLGIDCRYCHTTVEESAYAGMPATEICMNCHAQIWKESEMLEPVRASFRTGEPLAWTRVYDLPDYVYFDHSIHVSRGVACESCHGRVDQMPLMWKAVTLHMEWCLECHRHPERFIRPRDQVFAFTGDMGIQMEAPDPTTERNEKSADEALPRLSELPPASASDTESLELSRGEELVREFGIQRDQLTNCAICHR